MNDKTIKDIHESLDQFSDAYERVTNTLSSLISDGIEMREDIQAIEERVNNELAERVTSTRLWRSIAKIHRDKVEKLRIQIEMLTDEGHSIKMDIPLSAAEKKAIKEAIG